MARATTCSPKTKVTKPPEEAVTVPARPGGKLGLVVDRIAAEDGAMLSELVDLTGWQAHTVRAALSRLRQRGFAIRLEDRGDRNAYRIAPMEGEPC